MNFGLFPLELKTKFDCFEDTLMARHAPNIWISRVGYSCLMQQFSWSMGLKQMDFYDRATDDYPK